MKVIMKVFVVVFFILCIIYYFEIDVITAVTTLMSKDAPISTETNGNVNNSVINQGSAVMPEKGAENNESVEVTEEYTGIYDELIKFIINQKKDKKLVEGYRVLDETIGGDKKERAYIFDNALCSIALLNEGSEETKHEAKEILDNLAAIQNEEGSWYNVYDTSGQVVKISEKEYTKANTGDNAMVLYAYSYYTNLTGDSKFKSTMRKSADFILSRDDGKTGGLFDEDISAAGLRSLRSNTYAYFGIREYAMTNMSLDYNEYKNKLLYSNKLSDWILSSCIDKGVFIKGYTGKDKDTVLDLDSQILGALFIKAVDSDENESFKVADFEGSLTKLYQEIDDLKGYKSSDMDKNKGFIWGEGTSKAALAFMKFGERDKAKNVIESVSQVHSTVSKTLTPRGMLYSTNVDKKIDMLNLESASASAWAAIAFQCSSNEDVNRVCFGSEEEVFRKAK